MAQWVLLAATIKAAYDFLAHRIDASDLREGDHIYAFRSLMIYSHQGQTRQCGSNSMVLQILVNDMHAYETFATSLQEYMQGPAMECIG